jgi:hypothetical protein
MPDDIISSVSDIAALLGVSPDTSGTGDPVLSLLSGIKVYLAGGGVGPGVFVREFNGQTGIGVSVESEPGASGVTAGDIWFTLTFNDPESPGFPKAPTGWIIVPWEWHTYSSGPISAQWLLSESLLPIAAKDLHWVAVQNASSIEGYYVILSGPEEADEPIWELLGAAAVVPDGKTIRYNSAGELEVTARETWARFKLNDVDIIGSGGGVTFSNFTILQKEGPGAQYLPDVGQVFRFTAPYKGKLDVMVPMFTIDAIPDHYGLNSMVHQFNFGSPVRLRKWFPDRETSQYSSWPSYNVWGILNNNEPFTYVVFSGYDFRVEWQRWGYNSADNASYGWWELHFRELFDA